MAFSDLTLEDIYDNFEVISDWEDKYMYIIELGKKLYKLNDDYKIPENLVEGCVSRAWIKEFPEGKILEFKADSDSQIVRGLIAILFIAYSGKSSHLILEVDIEEVFYKLNLMQHLSGNRANGLRSMVKKIRSIAREHL